MENAVKGGYEREINSGGGIEIFSRQWIRPLWRNEHCYSVANPACCILELFRYRLMQCNSFFVRGTLKIWYQMSLYIWQFWRVLSTSTVNPRSSLSVVETKLNALSIQNFLVLTPQLTSGWDVEAKGVDRYLRHGLIVRRINRYTLRLTAK